MKKSYLFLFAVLLPLTAGAQSISKPATRTLMLSKYFGIDSKIPVEMNEEQFNAYFNQYMQQLHRDMEENRKESQKKFRQHKPDTQKTVPAKPAHLRLNSQPNFQPAWPLFEEKKPAWPVWDKSSLPVKVSAEKQLPVASAEQSKREAYRRELDKKRLVKAVRQILRQTAKK